MASKLKPRQQEAVEAALKGDVLCVLPTGYGKTHIFTELAVVLRSIVLVINPLTCIMDQQEALFGDACLKITEQLLCDGTEQLNERLSSGLKFILIHPEQAVQKQFKRFLMDTELSSKVSHIVVDEVHCVLSWGMSDFRPAYKKLGLLRVILPNAKIVGLTATATKKAQLEIMEVLNMTNASVIKASPDRPNVYLEVKRRPPSTGGIYSSDDSVQAVADPLLVELKEKGLRFPKSIIYVPLKWCGVLHQRAKAEFGVGDMVAQYHAPQSSLMKSHIVAQMRQTDSRLRLLLATEACGMGIDIPDIRRVEHISPPSNIETLIQEIGRCGRDGANATSSIHFNNSDIAKNRLHLQDEVKTYLATNKCRREMLLQYFDFSKEAMNDQKCCDNCDKHSQEGSLTNSDLVRNVPSFSALEKKRLRFALNHYFAEETKLCENKLISPLSNKLLEELCCRPECSDVNVVKNMYPTLSLNMCDNISKILEAVKILKT